MSFRGRSSHTNVENHLLEEFKKSSADIDETRTGHVQFSAALLGITILWVSVKFDSVISSFRNFGVYPEYRVEWRFG